MLHTSNMTSIKRFSPFLLSVIYKIFVFFFPHVPGGPRFSRFFPSQNFENPRYPVLPGDVLGIDLRRVVEQLLGPDLDEDPKLLLLVAAAARACDERFRPWFRLFKFLSVSERVKIREFKEANDI